MSTDSRQRIIRAVAGALATTRGDIVSATGTLAGVLDASAAIAGSDRSGVAWGRTYDSAVAQLLGEASRMASACAYFGVILSGGYADIVTETRPNSEEIPDLVVAAPSVVGERPVEPPQGWAVVGEYVGRPFPNGDPDALSRSAHGWRGAADAVRVIGNRLSTAVEGADTGQSPEAEPVVAVARELSGNLIEFAEACRALASVCVDYAQRLADTHRCIRSELKGFAIRSAGIEAGGAVFAYFTPSAEEDAVHEAVATRAAFTGSRIVGILEELDADADTLETLVASATDRLDQASSRLSTLLAKPIRLTGANCW